MANSFKQNFNKLIQLVYGKKDKSEKEIKNVIKKLNNYYSGNNQSNFYDLLSAIVNKTNNNKNSNSVNDTMTKILQNEDNATTFLNDLFSRNMRYHSYTSLIKKVSRLKRAIKILRSNILSSDSLNNTEFIVSEKSKTTSTADIDNYIQQTKEIITQLGLEKYKKEVIDFTLKYGDYFIEIVNSNEILKSTGILNESINLSYNNDNIKEENIEISNISLDLKLQFNKGNKYNYNIPDLLVEANPLKILDIDKSLLLESEDYNNEKEYTNQVDDTCSINDIILIKHKPHNVIKLRSGNITIGYLITPKMQNQNSNTFSSLTTGALSGFNQPQVGFGYGSNPMYSKSGGNLTNSDNKISSWNQSYQNANNISGEILKFFEKNIDKEIVDENPELKNTIVNLIFSMLSSKDYQIEKNGKLSKLVLNDLKFRFVTINYMQEFCIDKDEYAPYGTSILDNIEFDSKMLVSSKVASAIERLTKASERRIIEFETDNRDSVSVVQRLKEALRKTRVTFDDNTSVDTIPSIIGPFEDYYLPVKDGQRYVNFSSDGQSSNLSGRIEDLKFLRDEIVSNLEIPAAYLGLEENIESKSTLTLQNIVFAITVLDYQQIFSEAFTMLIEKIKKITGEKESLNKVVINLPKPIILTTASEIEHISSVAGIKDFLKDDLKISIADLVKRYLPYLSSYLSESNKASSKLDELINKNNDNNSSEEESGGF